MVTDGFVYMDIKVTYNNNFICFEDTPDTTLDDRDLMFKSPHLSLYFVH